MKAMKIAGEIAEKSVKYLAFAYILDKTIGGYQQGGMDKALQSFKESAIDYLITSGIESALVALGFDSIPILITILVGEFLIHKFQSILKN